MNDIKLIDTGSKLLDESNTTLLCPICESTQARIGYALVNVTDNNKIVTMGVTCENNHIWCLQFSDEGGSVYLNAYGIYTGKKNKAEKLRDTVIKRTKSRLTQGK